MKAYCKKTYFGFEKGNSYEVVQINSVFQTDDFITIKTNDISVDHWHRFRLNQSTQYVEDYIGENEVYFYDYFSLLKEVRKNKLKQLSNVTEV